MPLTAGIPCGGGPTNVPQSWRPCPGWRGGGGGRPTPEAPQRLPDVSSSKFQFATGRVFPRRVRRLSRLGRGPPVTPGGRLREAPARIRRHGESGGTWRPKAEGTWTQGGSVLEKERRLKNGMEVWGAQSCGHGQTQTRAPLLRRPPPPRDGRRPPRRSPALPVRPLRAAGRRRAHTMRRFQTWLRSRSRRAGAGAGGTEGRKEPVGPRL